MWQTVDNQLQKEFRFADFKTALEFVNRVGQAAEAANHHPDIQLSWGLVKICLSTHDAGTITDKDKQIAKEIDTIYGK